MPFDEPLIEFEEEDAGLLMELAGVAALCFFGAGFALI